MPSLSALVTDSHGKELVEVSRLIGRISRYYAVPPGTAAEIVALLRKAFDDTMRDPEFLRVARLANLPINPRAAAAVEQSVTELLNLSPTVRDRVSGNRQAFHAMTSMEISIADRFEAVAQAQPERSAVNAGGQQAKLRRAGRACRENRTSSVGSRGGAG